jgi:hypothetical protein
MPAVDAARAGESRALGLQEGDRDGKRPGPAMAAAGYFPSAAEPPLHREAK